MPGLDFPAAKKEIKTTGRETRCSPNSPPVGPLKCLLQRLQSTISAEVGLVIGQNQTEE
jgi:hypothetical protein